jgi:hypothetical protein
MTVWMEHWGNMKEAGVSPKEAGVSPKGAPGNMLIGGCSGCPYQEGRATLASSYPAILCS